MKAYQKLMVEKTEPSNKSNKSKHSKNVDKFKKKQMEIVLYMKNPDILQWNVNIKNKTRKRE